MDRGEKHGLIEAACSSVQVLPHPTIGCRFGDWPISSMSLPGTSPGVMTSRSDGLVSGSTIPTTALIYADYRAGEADKECARTGMQLRSPPPLHES